MVPAYATAPALLFVACIMAKGITELDWEDVTEYAPAALCMVTMPLTFSIAHGIAFGFIAYAVAKLLSGRMNEVSWAVWALAAIFILKYALGIG
jgi:AGZA family xanthine/uracil permease-like MFS transporter